MDIREVMVALRASWWFAVVGLVLGGALGLVVSLLVTPQYTATTQLFVSTTGASTTSDVFTGSQFSQQRVASYARLLSGEELAARVVEDLELPLTPRELTEQVTVGAVPETVLLDVAVTDPSAERAFQIAEALGSEFEVLVRELETPEGTDVSPVTVTVVESPELPSAPSEPRPVRNIALGLVLGLVLGVAGAVARARLDRSVRDPEEASALAGAPLIGTVLRDEVLAKRHVTDRSSTNRSAEDYRQLRTNLRFLSVDRPPAVIMVSSALPGEGKTTMAINLALALADAGQRVVLVEADLRRPRVTRYLGLVGGVGLTNVLAGTAEIDEVIQTYGAPGIAVLGAGPIPPNPGELLTSGHMATLLDKLRGTHDCVILDAPPLLPVADASGLAPQVDGVLLSVRHGATHKEQLRQAAHALERVNARLLGIVLNIVSPKAGLASDRGYGYGYEERNGKHAEE
jgi:receptor protein-tyrosine kinase